MLSPFGDRLRTTSMPRTSRCSIFATSCLCPTTFLQLLLCSTWRLNAATSAFHAAPRHLLGRPQCQSFLTPYQQVNEMMDRIMCPSLPNASHVLINPLAAEALRAKKGIAGTIVPDGFNFDRVVPISTSTPSATSSKCWSVIRDPLALTTWWWRCRPESLSIRRSSWLFSLWRRWVLSARLSRALQTA